MARIKAGLQRLYVRCAALVLILFSPVAMAQPNNGLDADVADAAGLPHPKHSTRQKPASNRSEKDEATHQSDAGTPHDSAPPPGTPVAIDASIRVSAPTAVARPRTQPDTQVADTPPRLPLAKRLQKHCRKALKGLCKYSQGNIRQLVQCLRKYRTRIGKTCRGALNR
ncbi:MAG: hypothetical protein VX589_19195 [Myxococcota bacterium]|nr:hypothetical protein [Myxococcota bacterium]